MSGMNLNVSMFTTTGNSTLHGTWNIYTSGITRVNSALGLCETATTNSPAELKLISQYRGEGFFLRAYYLYMLWRSFGSVPFQETLYEPPYVGPQLSPDEVYAQIIKDVDASIASFKEAGVKYSTNGGANSGRASLAAALMLKARVVMYQKDQSRYAEVANDMATIIKSGKFDLMDDFDAMWLDDNEFCKESIFESNQLPEGKTWSTGWQGYGTNLPAFISPNGLNDPSGVFNGGWGFAPVRQSAYNMYEEGDLRRDASINDWSEAEYAKRFQDTGLFQRKYAARKGYNPPPGDTDLNYCNNLRIFRYAETLLNYVELVKMDGVAEQQGVGAQSCLDQIRKRAFGKDASIPATAANIKAERHKEFLGEGMRFYDLVRWGDAASVLTENNTEYNSVRTYDENKKYLPIPQTEIDKTKGTEFELKQNTGY